MGYIRHDELPRLREYRYSGVDKSLLSRYVLKPFYGVVINLFPMSMAPNAITLSGFVFVIINLLTLLWYNPTLDQDIPPWLYATFAVGLFLYQTFDAVDGAQARRTRQSGPLGELFDHGVDALNTMLECIIFSATMHFGQSWKTMASVFASLLTFYVQTWDEYHTKTLTLGIVSGPVEGILTLSIVYAITAYIGGGSFWTRSLLATVGAPRGPLPAAVYDLAWRDWYLVYGGFVLVLNTLQSAANVMESRRKRGMRADVALLGLVPVFAAWSCITAFLALYPRVLATQLVPFILFVGLLNAYAVGRIIVAHLVSGPFPYDFVLVAPLALVVLDGAVALLGRAMGLRWRGVLGDGHEVEIVYALLGLAAGVYGSFVVDVIGAITEYLDIYCLTIKHPYRATEDKRK